MFEQEFKGLPYEHRKALEGQLEDYIRKIHQKHSLYLRDRNQSHFTNHEISVMIYNIFDLVSRLRNSAPDSDIS